MQVRPARADVVCALPGVRAVSRALAFSRTSFAVAANSVLVASSRFVLARHIATIHFRHGLASGDSDIVRDLLAQRHDASWLYVQRSAQVSSDATNHQNVLVGCAPGAHTRRVRDVRSLPANV